MHVLRMAQSIVVAFLSVVLTLFPVVGGAGEATIKRSGVSPYDTSWTPSFSKHIRGLGLHYAADGTTAAEVTNDTCLNGGRPDRGGCECPDQRNFTGMRCEMCQRDDVCSMYSGEPSECDHSLAIRGTNKLFQCSLDDAYIFLLGEGRPVQGVFALNCSTEDNTAFGPNRSGICDMTLYRVEPNHEFVDPFLHCNASQCSMQLVSGAKNDRGNSSTKLYRVFKAVTLTCQVVLVTLCALLALLRFVLFRLGQRRMAKTVTGLSITLVAVTLVFIAGMLVYMRPIDREDMVVYSCKRTSCQCAADPPPQYTPVCSEMQLKTYLENVENEVRLECNPRTGLCQITITDYSIVFGVECSASECVNTKRFPDKPSAGNSDITQVQHHLLVVLLFTAAVVIVSIAAHAAYLFARSRRGTVDFIRIFGFLEPQQQSETRLLVDEDDDESNDDGGKNLLREKQQQQPVSLPVSVNRQSVSSVENGVTCSETCEDSMQSLSAADVKRLLDGSCLGTERLELCRRLVKSSFELQVSNLSYVLFPSCLCGGEEPENSMILNKVTLSVQSGDVLAILGPSGAGKTTLLDILSARAKQGRTNGTICFNNTLIDFSFRKLLNQYRNMIGYVSQDDTLLPALTVYQAIEYAARLKLPSVFSRTTIRSIVRRIIETLKLEQCEHTVIGDGSGVRGVSGGERRRVSIAVELLANPRILFLDEPTSGLDAVSARRVVEAVVKLAKESPMQDYAPHFFAFKPIVIFSIHQPSQEVYGLFDKLLLLSRGVSLYCGPACDAAAILEARVKRVVGSACDVPCRVDYPNDAEYLMKLEEIIDGDARIAIQEEDASQAGAFCKSSEPIQASGSGNGNDQLSGDKALVNGSDVLYFTNVLRRYYANTYQQIRILTSRAFCCLISSFHLVVCHAAVTASVGVLMLLLYNNQSLDLPGSLNRAGAITFLLLVLSLVSLSCLEHLVAERKLLVVERENGYYSTTAYFISKMLVDIAPLRILPALVLASIIYFPMGLRVDDGIHFFWFLFIVTTFSVCMTLFVMCIGVVTKTFGAAALLSSVVILWNFVFGGLLAQSETTPEFLQPFKFASPFFLAFESLLVNELNGQVCTFSPTDETGKPSSTSFSVPCAQYLTNIGLRATRFNLDVGLLVAFTFAFTFLAWLLLAKCTSIAR